MKANEMHGVLLNFGFRYLGVCSCAARIRKYGLNGWLAKVYPVGHVRLFYKNKLFTGETNFEKVTEIIRMEAIQKPAV
jgi:hypothetical protein